MFCHLWSSPRWQPCSQKSPCGSINCWQFLPAWQGPGPSSLCLIILYILKCWLFKLKINFTAFFFVLMEEREACLLLVGKLENRDKKKKKFSSVVVLIYPPSAAVCENFSATSLSAFGVSCPFHFSHYVQICIPCVNWSFGHLDICFLKCLFRSFTHFSLGVYDFFLLICRNLL